MQQIFVLPLQRLLVGALLLLAICSGRQWAVESHSFQSLSELLDSTGLGEDHEGPMSEQQLQLIGQISSLYEQEDNLHSREAALLNKVGRSRPDGKQKGTLEVMLNKHLINMDKLEELRNQLKQSVASGGQEQSTGQ